MIGDYQVRALSASSGVVRYAATHAVLPRHAVIELVDAGAPRGTSVRLLRLGCILEALQHPGVPRVFECGVMESRPWLALERAGGVSLDVELLQRRLDVAEVLDLIEGVAAILTHAHARGVLHRDITPAAIVRNDGRIMLDHWGHACTIDSELPTPRRACTRYQARELIEERAVDGSADVFALGAVAYEALTGEPGAQHLTLQPAALATLLAEMVADDALARPTATELVDHVRAIRASWAEPAEPPLPLESELEVVADEPFAEELVIDVPRSRPRWTPQYDLADEAAVARRVVDVLPRRPRTEEP